MTAPFSHALQPHVTEAAAQDGPVAQTAVASRTGGAEHNAVIDSLRGIAAAVVVVFHMEFWGFPIVPGNVAFLGALGVNLFFTLSGFLIARAALAPAQFDLRKYLKNRALRILPNYYICCFLVLFLVNGREIGHNSAGSLAFDLGAHALLLHSWFQSTADTINGPMWTLGHEWMFYLLLGFAAPWLRARGGWRVPVLMFVIAIATKYLVMTRLWQPSTGRSHPFCLWDQFAFGIAGALLSAQVGRMKGKSFWVTVAGVGGLLVIAACLYWQYACANAEVISQDSLPRRGTGNNYAAVFYMRRSNVIWFPPVFSLGVAMLLVAVTNGWRKAGGWLRRTPLPWMGKVSYSTYLYHMSVLLCLERAFGSAPAGSLFATHGVAACLAALAGTYLLSAFCYHYFEEPWLARKSPPASPA